MSKPHFCVAVAIFCAASITACAKPDNAPPDTASAATNQMTSASTSATPHDPGTSPDTITKMGFDPEPDLHIIKDYNMARGMENTEPALLLEVSMKIRMKEISETRLEQIEQKIMAHDVATVLPFIVSQMRSPKTEQALALVKAALGCEDLNAPTSETKCKQTKGMRGP
jgi:hypothetical protein